ncbi:probable serine/threonine-protein kinase DDB_G0277165 isoform X2 [Hylaeus volcanicus]|uniref:probable serine/threonine-protein kinase DDB_G0277165 isoform X2 n=1 Tax=Hylaeus volcanicus TaxID=313075 RepID=UPI0023B853A1|nr:probable serine/threonine-protein kinase DDB_G0277165 isoform X2 [Hylaeus volcanicus]
MKTEASSFNSHRWTSIHDQYQTLEVLGQGTYGVVYKAEHKITKNIVGLKRCRLDTFKDFGIPETTLREVSLLRDLRHENIMTLYHISCNTVRLYMVCEYLDQDLKKYIRSHQNGIPLNEIKHITFSILQGLAFCHGHRIIHRDLKPHNILLSNDTSQVKIADFGLARSCLVAGKTLTHEVVTLWYRAPELLLGDCVYDTNVDMWSVGCIVAELLSGTPLFAGDCEIDTLFRICRLLGTPPKQCWPKNSVVSWEDFPKLTGNPDLFKHLSPALDEAGQYFLLSLLQFSSSQRMTALQALNHPWLDDIRQEKQISKSFMYPEYLLWRHESMIRNQSENSKKSYSKKMVSQSEHPRNINSFDQQSKTSCYDASSCNIGYQERPTNVNQKAASEVSLIESGLPCLLATDRDLCEDRNCIVNGNSGVRRNLCYSDDSKHLHPVSISSVNNNTLLTSLYGNTEDYIDSTSYECKTCENSLPPPTLLRSDPSFINNTEFNYSSSCDKIESQFFPFAKRQTCFSSSNDLPKNSTSMPITERLFWRQHSDADDSNHRMSQNESVPINSICNLTPNNVSHDMVYRKVLWPRASLVSKLSLKPECPTEYFIGTKNTKDPFPSKSQCDVDNDIQIYGECLRKLVSVNTFSSNIESNSEKECSEDVENHHKHKNRNSNFSSHHDNYSDGPDHPHLYLFEPTSSNNACFPKIPLRRPNISSVQHTLGGDRRSNSRSSMFVFQNTAKILKSHHSTYNAEYESVASDANLSKPSYQSIYDDNISTQPETQVCKRIGASSKSVRLTVHSGDSTSLNEDNTYLISHNSSPQCIDSKATEWNVYKTSALKEQPVYSNLTQCPGQQGQNVNSDSNISVSQQVISTQGVKKQGKAYNRKFVRPAFIKPIYSSRIQTGKKGNTIDIINSQQLFPLEHQTPSFSKCYDVVDPLVPSYQRSSSKKLSDHTGQNPFEVFLDSTLSLMSLQRKHTYSNESANDNSSDPPLSYNTSSNMSFVTKTHFNKKV